MIPDIDDDAVFAALRVVLLDALPEPVEVLMAQVNRVPETKTPDFVLMTEIGRSRLSTTVEEYDFAGLSQSLQQATEVSFQLDIHGPKSANNAQVIATLLRSAAGCKKFASAAFEISPLTVTEPKQQPFINAEAEYEYRWVTVLGLQINPKLLLPEEFATELQIGVKEIDATFPVS